MSHTSVGAVPPQDVSGGQVVTPTALDIAHLTVSYGDHTALRDVSITVPAGARVGVVGPNGSGKTTLLHAIVGLARGAAGRINVLGQSVSAARVRVAFLPQREQLRWDFPATVLDVVLLGRTGRLGWFKRPAAGDRHLAMAALDRVDMTRKAGVPVGNLSGGEQQRVFLARALAQDADMYLLDEPLNGLDMPTYASVLDVMAQECAAGKTVIMATHDLATARSWCSHVLFLRTEMVAFGPTKEVFTPAILTQTYGSHLILVGNDAEGVVAIEQEGGHAH